MFCPNCGYDCKDANFCPNCGASLKENTVPVSPVPEQPIPPLNEPYYQEINGQRIDLHKLIRTYGNGMRKIGAFTFLETNYGVTKAQAKEILEPLYKAHAGEKITFADGLKAQAMLQHEATQAKEALKKQDQEIYASGEYTKVCLNCGDRLLTAAKKCPTCGNKTEFAVVEKTDTEKIRQLQQNVPNPKEGLTAKWKSSSLVQSATQNAQKDMKKQQIRENRANGIVCCPKCGSTSVTAQKKGFSFVKGAIGATVGLDVGLIAGGAGANKVILTCMNCGHQWKPGKK